MMEKKISYLKSLQVVHSALLVGQLLFAVIGFYVAYKSIIHPLAISEEMQKPVLYIMLAVPGILTWLAFFIYRNKVRAVPEEGTETEIRNRYRALNLIRWAMIEASTLLLIICGMVTSQKTFFAAAVLIIIIFFFTKPSKDRMLAEAGLEDADMQ